MLNNSNTKEANDWSSIKKKMFKTYLIDNFIINNSIKYKLDDDTMQKLLSKIYTGIFFKLIPNEDIVYSNNIIKSIKGIKFSKNKFKFKYNVTRGDNITCFNVKNKISKCNTNVRWKKYVENLKDKSLKVF